MNGPDYDRIAVLRTRLNHARGPDRRLGYEIIVALLPGTQEAQKASELLRGDDVSTSVKTVDLDFTASIDAVFKFLEQRELTAYWSLLCNAPRAGEEPDPAGPYTAYLVRGIFSHSGSGWTAPSCLFDLAIQAICSGADGYSEGESIPLFATPDPKGVDLIASWSDNLKDLTREAVVDFWPQIEMWGKLRLKHRDGRFATVESYELERGVLRVVDAKSKTFFDFPDVEALIDAGWAVD
ncbi:hypothetical protein FV232_02915 [Methylobacterium sp. WL30]|uniref:hypothetical protein n=1 Tax=unclassified Methylobacterium TaxID=2615210 RepID=UPI0011C88C9E|nr:MULTISPECIES: hypothetical protein [unclassified Methylobacterium]TXN33416.1 hypothetical protein FV225_18830 [Methylobacterium sp. WL93]TXN51798.1 hypothetical protein FV227_06585 [Methylobacterium sp. WL119]TXN70284.1 hypothetical protein FV232_02915 [Methylobacterium sp. WL30]